MSDAEEPTAPASGLIVPSTVSPVRSLVVDTPVAKPLTKRDAITRRVFLLGGFFSTLGLLATGLTGIPLDFMWLKRITGFGGPVKLTADRIPKVGADPIQNEDGRFWLVNLEAGTTPHGEPTPGGLIALYRKCPHLGCTVPYNPDFTFEGRKGWFRCPCHNSTYTKEGGVIVFGPAPRPMDVFPIEVQPDLSIIVQTGRQFEFTGSPNNPSRTVIYKPGEKTPEAG